MSGVRIETLGCYHADMTLRARPALILVLLILAPAYAVIHQLYPLKRLIADAQSIALMRVDRAGDAVFTVRAIRQLKGAFPYADMRIVIDSDVRSQNRVLSGLLRPGLDMVVLYSVYHKPEGPQPVALAYCEGKWMRLGAEHAVLTRDGDRPSRAEWKFVHFEPGLRRSYHGSTAGLARIAAGQLEAPPPDPTLPVARPRGP